MFGRATLRMGRGRELALAARPDNGARRRPLVVAELPLTSGRSLLNQMMQASTLLPPPSLLLHVGLVSPSPPFVTVTETAWFEKIFRTMIEAC
jgi:hypothetical protein